MANPPTNLRLDITRRASRWTLLSAALASLVVVTALLGHAGRTSMTIFSIACAVAWFNDVIQFRAYRAALSERPANER